MRHAVFLEAVFERFKPNSIKVSKPVWHDKSTADFFIFESAFGIIRIRKRYCYPQTFARVYDGLLVVGYGIEATAMHLLGQPLDTIDESLFYDEFLLITVDAIAQQVSISRDATSTLPLFIGCQSNRFFISNKYEQIYQLLTNGPLHIDTLSVAQTILQCNLHGTSLIKEITALYDRRRVYWPNRSGGFDIVYPPSGMVHYIGENTTANAKDFRRALEQTIQEYQSRYLLMNKR